MYFENGLELDSDSIIGFSNIHSYFITSIFLNLRFTIGFDSFDELKYVTLQIISNVSI